MSGVVCLSRPRVAARPRVLASHVPESHVQRLSPTSQSNVPVQRPSPTSNVPVLLLVTAPSTELFSKKNHVLFSNFFPFSNMFFIRLFLANNWKKNRMSPCLFPHKLPWKVDMVFRSQSGWRICAVGTGTRHKMAPIVFEGCSRYQACFRLFLCVWCCQHWNSYLRRVQK